MAKIAVVYESKYGYTEQYAKWIAEDTGAELLKTDSVKSAEQLLGYDLILFGSGLYNGKIGIASYIKKNAKILKFKKFGIFISCSSDGSAEYRAQIKEKNLPEDLRKARLFQLRGGLSKKLSIADSMAVAMQKASISKKETRSREDLMILGMFESPQDYTDRENLQPLLEYVNSGAWKLQ